VSCLAGFLCVKKLELGERLADLLGRLLGELVDERPAGLDPDAGLLEVALVLLGDPARGQIEDADHALQDHVLDPDLLDLLFEALADLLFTRFGTLGFLRSLRILVQFGTSSTT
jgi:hypothetical protein